ncbi:MAG TPA: RNA-guided endonuclease IscB [Bacilli bacterium]|nr:RNA-guided endonuclease IscB [Bacilli bacterium]
MTEYCFVLDCNGKQLSPTKTNKGWYLIRKQKATLVSKYPMVIQLKKEVKDEEDESEFIVGIDDGSKHVGIAIVQKCKTKNKVVFKGTIEQRQDVKHLMEVRRGYRRYHRQHKRYRKVRFDNRASSKCIGRIAPTIRQKKDAILRVINRLNKLCKINKIILEDVQINIRALQDGKLYKWQYQKSNRLDENLRIATLMRDKYICQECGKRDCILEAHHIIPRRLSGNDSIYNLITLCSNCHDKTKGKEEEFIKKYQEMIKGKNINFSDAQHVMQGKTYLRQELNNIAPLSLTIGSETVNKRIDWDIEKSHSNDAIVITGLKPDNCDIKEWAIRPMRRKSKAKHSEVKGFKHRDLVKYTKKNGETYVGWITALYPEKKQCNITTLDGQILKRYGIKSLKLLWRFHKIYWLCA